MLLQVRGLSDQPDPRPESLVGRQSDRTIGSGQQWPWYLGPGIPDPGACFGRRRAGSNKRPRQTGVKPARTICRPLIPHLLCSLT